MPLFRNLLCIAALIAVAAPEVLPPGTDMSKLSSARDSVAGMIRIIDDFSLANSGTFYGDKGAELPW